MRKRESARRLSGVLRALLLAGVLLAVRLVFALAAHRPYWNHVFAATLVGTPLGCLLADWLLVCRQKRRANRPPRFR